MRYQMRFTAGLFLAAVASLCAGCHSAHVEVTVENRTGNPVRLLEVDYPNASFGADELAAGESMHYRIQVQGSGPVKVQYGSGDGRQAQVQGPELADRQEGALEIVLLPGGKADFHSQPSARR